MNKQTIGKIGEDLACEYLAKKGYKILKRNYREKWDEIDIIAKDKRQTIVFVEVKALEGVRDGMAELTPEDNLTAAKLHKLQRACQAFAAKNEDLIDGERGWRIDLVAIELTGQTVDNHEPRTANHEPTTRHYENI